MLALWKFTKCKQVMEADTTGQMDLSYLTAHLKYHDRYFI